MMMIVVLCPGAACPIRSEFDPQGLPSINNLEIAAKCPKIQGVIGNPPIGSLSSCETLNLALIEARRQFLDSF
jgi:hypothetical protein